jgi:L-fuculose-phosphate aldolase
MMSSKQATLPDIGQEVIEIALTLLESGLVVDTHGNVSAREGEAMLITPSRRDFRLLTKTDLVRVDLGSGRPEGRWKPSSEWQLHATIYRMRPDVHAVVHHHAVWASAVSVARKTIPILIDEVVDIGEIPTAPYAPSASRELAEVAAAEFARGRNAVLLANHGAVAVGRWLREAFRRAVEVERLARIYLGATLLGGAHPLDEAAVNRSRAFFAEYRADAEQSHELPVEIPRVLGPVRLQDLVNYSFRAGVTFASLVHALVLQKLHR